MPQVECPLCHATASMKSTAFGERKHYQCLNCKDFVITEAAERLVKKIEERRARFAALARKGSDDNFLLIERAPTIHAGEPPELQFRFLSRRNALNSSTAQNSQPPQPWDA